MSSSMLFSSYEKLNFERGHLQSFEKGVCNIKLKKFLVKGQLGRAETKNFAFSIMRH